MNVLSLFDGISCGRIALERAGIKVDRYYSSEIDKYASSIAKFHYPDNIELGDVTKRRDWNIDWSSVDLLIGGSPCQSFSVAGKGEGFQGKSGLFYAYADILNHIRSYNPNVKFLLENVKMKKDWRDEITNCLGVEPILINSALLSAQNRERLYWCNWSVEQPEDKGIMLKDILINKEDITVIRNKGVAISRPYKSTCLDSNYWKGIDNHGQRTCILEGHAIDIKGHDIIRRVYSPDGKSPTLTAICGGNQEPKVALGFSDYRKLTALECERLQTIPDNYTSKGFINGKVVDISNSARYKMIGNGWTVDVIAYILKGINHEQ